MENQNRSLDDVPMEEFDGSGYGNAVEVEPMQSSPMHCKTLVSMFSQKKALVSHGRSRVASCSTYCTFKEESSPAANTRGSVALVSEAAKRVIECKTPIKGETKLRPAPRQTKKRERDFPMSSPGPSTVRKKIDANNKLGIIGTPLQDAQKICNSVRKSARLCSEEKRASPFDMMKPSTPLMGKPGLPTGQKTILSARSLFVAKQGVELEALSKLGFESPERLAGGTAGSELESSHSPKTPPRSFIPPLLVAPMAPKRSKTIEGISKFSGPVMNTRARRRLEFGNA